jgi:hypothetical protein
MQKKSLARSLLWILKYPSLRRFAFLACHSLYFHSVASSFNLTSGQSNLLYLVLRMKWSFRAISGGQVAVHARNEKQPAGTCYYRRLITTRSRVWASMMAMWPETRP